MPTVDGGLEARLLEAFERAADDFTGFRADSLAAIAMGALAEAESGASGARDRMVRSVRSAAYDLDEELKDRLGWDEAHAVRDRLLAVADGVDA